MNLVVTPDAICIMIMSLVPSVEFVITLLLLSIHIYTFIDNLDWVLTIIFLFTTRRGRVAIKIVPVVIKLLWWLANLKLSWWMMYPESVPESPDLL
jgi:hypothetical protein